MHFSSLFFTKSKKHTTDMENMEGTYRSSQTDLTVAQVSGGPSLLDRGKPEHLFEQKCADRMIRPEPGHSMALENETELKDSSSSMQQKQDPKCKGDIELLESALIAWKNQSQDNDLREKEVFELRRTIEVMKRNADEKTLDLQKSLELQQATIDALHSELNWLDNLKKDIVVLKKKNAGLESQIQAELELSAGRKKEHAEMVNSLKTLHREEIEQTTIRLNRQLETVKGEFEDKIRVQDEEIAKIKQQLIEAEKDKEREVSITKMEFENKIRKLQQKKTLMSSNQQTPPLNQDIYRKKLQHLKTEYEKENMTLKDQIKFLHQQLNSKCVGKKSFTK